MENCSKRELPRFTLNEDGGMGEWGRTWNIPYSPTPEAIYSPGRLRGTRRSLFNFNLIDFLVGEMLGLTVNGQPLTVNIQQ
ncbi:MAG: hypothetical protein F6K65_15690 [Moorea sp. SIO3C2]|nr:hypothetical protein [Moorena sp. SIO3C2]